MNRRGFIATSAGLVSLGVIYRYLPSDWLAPKYELALAYGDWVGTEIEKVDPPLPSYLVFLNPETYKMTTFNVPFRVHMLVQNPRRPESLVLISKWGTQIAAFDRRAGKVTSVMEAQPNHRFFGHAVWEGDGFWVTEMDDVNHRGKLVFRGPDLQVRREMSSHGIFPHEVQMAGDGLLLVANSGDFIAKYDSLLPHEARVASLSWISSSTGEIRRRVEFPEHLGRAGCSHFAQIPGRGEVFCGTMIVDQNLPTVAWRIFADNRVQQIEAAPNVQDQFRGEIVSFGYCRDAGRVFWSHSKAKGVFSYDLRAGRYAELSVPHSAKGLIGLEHDVLIANGDGPKLIGWRDGHAGVRATAPRLERAILQWGSHFSKLNLS
jgi:hypothetical protein